MLKLKKKNILVKTYSSLPLWGKIALPAIVLVLAFSVIKMLKTVFYVGVAAALIYVVASAWFYLKNSDK